MRVETGQRWTHRFSHGNTLTVNAVTIGFVFYLALVLVAGAITYRMTKTQEDFLLAGRKLNIWVATFSERASGESVWILLGLPAVAMTSGLVEVWVGVGCVCGITFSWFVIAQPLRDESERLNALTLTEYFSARFGDMGNAIRFTATAIIIFFYSFYVATQFSGAGKILNVTFELPLMWGVTIGTVVVILYTMAGGFIAVAWTDLLQAIIMFGTLVILPVVGLYALSAQDTQITDAFVAAPNLGSLTGGKTGFAAAAAVIGGLSWGFGYLGQPHTVTRFMSVSNSEDLKKGRWIAMAWAIPAFIGSIGIGLVGANYYAPGTFADADKLMPTLATDLLPGWLAGIFISGAIAAMMSTADSQLLVGTSAVAEDLTHKALGVELTQKQLVRLSRAVTVLIGLAGFVLAITSDELIFNLVSYAWAGLGAAFGPALVLSLHWKKTTGAGVLAGMLTGAISTVIWGSFDVTKDLVSERVTSFVFAWVAVMIVSSLTSTSAKKA